MKQLSILPGRHVALGHLVRARLEVALAGRIAVTLRRVDSNLTPQDAGILRELGVEFGHAIGMTEDDKADCLVVLDSAEADSAAPSAARRIDWSLLGAAFAHAAASDSERRSRLITADGNLRPRIEVLLGLLDVPEGPPASEFHGSIRVHDLARSVRFYAWLLDTWPREWTHRYATFVRADLALTFVLLVADGKELHHDTLYHLGIGVADSAAVVDAYHRALTFGARVGKPPRTTWRGTPLHELWLEDPDGTLIEIYARLTNDELSRMPADQEPEYLVPGTAS
jgi:catechol 2,3-dioxygenase-like lactoylglutathione lyase family enzyme